MSTDRRQAISAALAGFDRAALPEAARHFLRVLGYASDRTIPMASPSEFCGQFDPDGRLDQPSALKPDWKSIHLLFQLTDQELARESTLFKDSSVNPGLLRSYLFFAVELTGSHYARTKLTGLARQINRLFPMPVMVLIKHRADGKPVLSIAVINRRPSKRDAAKDVLGKVTIIRDISFTAAHTGHLDILASFALPNLVHPQRIPINNFDALHAAWEEIFNVELLNRRFYEDLARWYFWALPQVQFPADIEPDDEKRNATSLIRLLTRLIFCWFLKEKQLIPEKLFNQAELEDILIDLDPDSCTYFQGILQNLFFATLNQRMGKDKNGTPFRGFAKDEGFLKNRQNHGVDNLYRYEEHFRDSDAALAHFADVPFLNGGLFERLDPIDEATEKQLYLDGFTRNKKKRASVPNRLFFGQGELDINQVTGEKRKGKVKALGLLRILHAYKFTIVENTPIDQEIALDPELLGKVFENLLASYNEETKTTARKQTGSFYTPRPIVEYMVDETLNAHLCGALVKAGMREKDAQAGLDILFAYTEKQHPFTDAEADTLLAAIHTCKILDPACGSGAFPMGMLQKLVYIIHKLDPDNAKWMQLQIDTAGQIPDSSAREAAIAAIERDFAENEDDYGRKLYLIENCLYGVDIQPIAIQISKLRFFISLVCDQRTNRNKKDNHGVRPLPNLETKFVAADTLIGLPEMDQLELVDPQVHKIEAEIEALYHSHFSIQRRDQKLALQRKIKQRRKELGRVLVGSLMAPKKAQHIADWDPFDPQASSDFFDPHWMFGQSLAHGFGIVLGNPPYLGFRDMDAALKARVKPHYAVAQGKFDLYVLFIQRASQLLSEAGILSFIMPTAFAKRDYGAAIRRFILDNLQVDIFVDFGHEQMFDAVTNYTGILQLRKSTPPKKHVFMFKYGSLESDSLSITQDSLSEDPWVILSPGDQRILEVIFQGRRPLGRLATISEGVVTGLNDLYLLEMDVRLARLPFFKPCLRGRDIRRYSHAVPKELLFYPYAQQGRSTVLINEQDLTRAAPGFMADLKEEKPKILSRGYFKRSSKAWYELWNQRSADNFECQKVVTPELADHSRFAVADQGVYYGDTVCGIVPKDGTSISPHALVTILNSSVVQWYYKKATVPKANGFFIYKVMFLKHVPIPSLSESAKRSLDLCGRLLCSVTTAELEHVVAANQFLEDLVDACVLECYFHNHMAERDLLFLDDLAPHLDGYDPDAAETQQRDFLDYLYRTLNAPNSKTRNRLLRISADSPDLLAVIKAEGRP